MDISKLEKSKGFRIMRVVFKTQPQLPFSYIILKWFDLSEVNFLHQFSCFRPQVINTHLKVVGIIEFLLSHVSRGAEAARVVFGYYIGGSFVMIFTFPSCLQDGFYGASHCILLDKVWRHRWWDETPHCTPFSFIKRESILLQNRPPELTSRETPLVGTESLMQILDIKEARKVDNWHFELLEWEANSDYGEKG